MGRRNQLIVRSLTLALSLLLFGALAPAWGEQAQKVSVNRVKELLKAGKPAFGVVMQLASPPGAEILAQAGFDWLWIDMEHGPLNLETVHGMIQATRGTDTVPIVRVPWNLHWLAKPILDMGAMGVIMPSIVTQEEAMEAVRALRYPPEGIRGFGPGFAALRWGLSVPEYVKVANREIMAILLVEHIQAVDRIDEILSVPGVDVVMIGPYDLSGSMGMLGQVSHPKVEEAINRVLAAAQRAKIPAGILALTPDDIQRRLEQGFRFLIVGADTGFLAGGAKSILGQIKR
ncbi:MAG: aldolase/citrate lyase family protein [candidate division NC10 bacterium]|nr:aldolase/citrate lyase family protein [candidate division NC10 bacterium]